MNALFPQLLVRGTSYYPEWFARERNDNIRFWRLLFPVLATVYVADYVLFDRSQHLQQDLLVRFRFVIVLLCLATGALYYLPMLIRSRAYRLPAAVTMLALSYTQAKTIVWYDQDQYMLAFIVVVVATVLLRSTVLWSCGFAIVALWLQWPSLSDAGVSAAVAYSASVGTLLFVATSRAAYAGDIRYYLAHQGYVATQKRMFEMNLEFTDRIRAFLPKEISERLGARLQAQDTTVLRAVDEVLAPAEKHVACLYTDIRGFTKGTKGGDAFISEGVIPNVIGCTSAIEDHHGIPRKIGDLLFGYFDAASVSDNVVRCLRAACEIVDANARFNATNPLKIEIRRFVLVSTGRARVGNLGGFDSSIEITASGPPVNLLSRLDELTKNARFKDRVTPDDIVLCPATARLLQNLAPRWEMDELELESLGLKAAQFEGIESVWAFRNNALNRRRLLELGVALDSARLAPSALPN